MTARKSRSDPLWDMRRRFMFVTLAFCAGEIAMTILLVAIGWITAEEVGSISALTAAVAAFAGPLLIGYMGIAEWGSIKKSTVITEETLDVNPPTTTKTKTVETKPGPIVPTEDDNTPRG